jgi:PAS domain-containing protein
VWPTVTVLALIAAAAIHLWWRRRYFHSQAAAQFDIQALKERLQSETSRSESRQRAVFNSMIEGLLLLDERGSISWANQAFLKLFAVDADVRGRTVLEVLRRHELGELLDRDWNAN